MKKALSWLYRAAGALAACFLVAIGLFVLYSIGGGLFGYVARSADDFAGYCMAAASYLALAYTFAHGEHIRVTLLLQRLEGRWRRGFEIWCLGLGSFLACYLAYFAVKLVYVSYILNDVAQGLVATPLWIPQLGMAIGAVIFAIAVVERLVDLLRGAELPADSSDIRADR